jgi:hypothetical protein
MPVRFEWWHWLIVVAFIAAGTYTLITGNWHLRRNPDPTMVRIGGGAVVLIGVMGVLVGLGVLKEGQD